MGRGQGRGRIRGTVSAWRGQDKVAGCRKALCNIPYNTGTRARAVGTNLVCWQHCSSSSSGCKVRIAYCTRQFFREASKLWTFWTLLFFLSCRFPAFRHLCLCLSSWCLLYSGTCPATFEACLFNLLIPSCIAIDSGKKWRVRLVHRTTSVGGTDGTLDYTVVALRCSN